MPPLPLESPYQHVSAMGLVATADRLLHSTDQEEANSSLLVFERAWSWIKKLYRIQDPDAVGQFILRHLELIKPLLESPNYIEGLFGAGGGLELELVRDHEVDGIVELFVYIRTDEPLHQALPKLQSLDRDWFLERFPYAIQQFHFNLSMD